MNRLILGNKNEIAFFYLAVLLSSSQGWAQEPPTTTVMKEVIVRAEKDAVLPSLPSVDGTKIYSGKKTAVVEIQEAPTITNNNLRQAFEKTPGLLVSEESTPLISIGYRGLSPGRAQFTQVLKDGIPIHADMFGYPEAYYTPPFQVVDRIEFLHGGASLLYGPQPGGALNFVTRDPYRGAPFSLTQENAFGSHDYFSEYTALSGAKDAWGYYSYFHHRQSQGFRDFNSQYDVNYGGAKFTIDPDPTAKWTLGLDLYNETHGEPGGLTRAQFDDDPSVSTRLMDRFELNRVGGSVEYDKEISERTKLSAKAYGMYYERLSWRQRGGGFGTLPSGANASTNDIENQEFYTGGVEGRLRQDYSAFGSDEHTVTGGVLYHHTSSPRLDQRGTTGDAQDGAVRKDSDRGLDDVSLFAENRFKFGKLSVTPGVRLENIWQSVKEHVNLDKTTSPLADEAIYDFVALGGVGAEYEAAEALTVYGNFSQGYRPKIFTQAVPNGTNQIVNQDLQEGRSWQADAGLRGAPAPYFAWDVVYFYLVFDDQIGTVGNTFQNVGDAVHQGGEIAVELDIVGLWDAARSQANAEKIGAIALFYNGTFLDAEFTGGPNTGKTPQYAPDFIQKGGVEWRWKERAKVRLAGTFLDNHFADDGNTTTFIIPSYKVWDLTAESKIYKDSVSLFGGINNIFDEKYFSRVTGGGIDPADERNLYGGVKVIW